MYVIYDIYALLRSSKIYLYILYIIYIIYTYMHWMFFLKRYIDKKIRTRRPCFPFASKHRILLILSFPRAVCNFSLFGDAL